MDELLSLGRELGREDRGLAILGEGNVSARSGERDFWVKASGCSLATLAPAGITLCRFDRLLPLIAGGKVKDGAADEALLRARVDTEAAKPSVEALFHAWLLSLPDVKFVGHTHPVAVNSIVCSRGAARNFAARRLFPDQVVCCGGASVLVPYVDPGVPLARAIAKAVRLHVRKAGEVPRVILLENHGMIALGRTPAAVLAATLMTEKAAQIFLGASAAGGPKFLSEADVRRIAGRPDEHHRQRMLNL